MDYSDELRLIEEVSKLYYIKDLKQIQIAKKLYLSRTKVSRLLQKAKDMNIVRIYVGLGEQTSDVNPLEMNEGY